MQNSDNKLGVHKDYIMTTIDYFKLQAKNLIRDFNSKTLTTDAEDNFSYYEYAPKYFDLDGIVLDYDVDEDTFSLMKAQHLLAKMVGLNNWSTLLNASDVELELAKLKFINQDKIPLRDWEEYLLFIRYDTGLMLEAATEMDVYKHRLNDYEGNDNSFSNYFLDQKSNHETSTANLTPVIKTKQAVQIKKLPLNKKDRAEFIKTANIVFDHVFLRLEPQNPDLTRKLWNAEAYLDTDLLPSLKLPIDRDYALSIIDAVMVHHVIDLAVQADDINLQSH